VLPQYLEEHEYTHTGEKPFVCGINGCPETFRQRGKLSIHKKNSHPEAAGGGEGQMMGSNYKEFEPNQSLNRGNPWQNQPGGA
jgi:hypothetical protein